MGYVAKKMRKKDGSRTRPRDTFSYSASLLEKVYLWSNEETRPKSDAANAGLLAFFLLRDDLQTALVKTAKKEQVVRQLLEGDPEADVEELIVEGFAELARPDLQWLRAIRRKGPVA